MTKQLNLLIILYTIASLSAAEAQTFTAKGGLNFSTMVQVNGGEAWNKGRKPKLGFNLGVVAEFPVKERFSIETGLLISKKGLIVDYKEDVDNGYDETGVYQKLSLLYLDIPLTGKFSFELFNTSMHALCGPYFGIGLSGKYKFEYNLDEFVALDEGSVKWGKGSYDQVKATDFGWIFGIGANRGKMGMELNYYPGFKYISANRNLGSSLLNSTWLLSFTYKLNEDTE